MEMSPPPASAMAWDEPVRWAANQLSRDHALPLGQVLDLLAATDERHAVERMLGLLRAGIGAGPAHAIEYILQAGAVELRQVILAAGGATGSGDVAPCMKRMRADAAYQPLVALARGELGDGMLGLRCLVDAAPASSRPRDGEPVRRERVSVLYTVAPNTAWALHLYPAWPSTRFRDEDLSVLPCCAFLVREAHRIVSPAPLAAGDRVNMAEVRLGVRAPSLSSRERQICARIAGGHSAAAIAVELGISASTVMTLRKRAYEKLGVHGRLDLRQLAA